MKRIIPFIITLISLLSSCKQETNTENSKAESALDPTKEVWAELVESKTILVKPEGWDDAYWQSVNKKMDNHKIFNTILDAVINGKKQAYDLFTDSVLTVDQIKEMVNIGAETGKVYKKLDENGEYIGDKPLFYVNLN